MEAAFRAVRRAVSPADLAMRRHLVRPGASWDEWVDALELAIIDHPGAVELPLVHTFTPGLYLREIRAPAGTLATTYIHTTRHQFIVSQGAVAVLADGRARIVKAPHSGVTEAGTRRICFVLEDAVWTSVHATTATSVEEAEREIYTFRELPDGSNVRDRFTKAVGGRRVEVLT